MRRAVPFAILVLALALVVLGPLAMSGCAWIDRVDPPVQYQHGPGCGDLGDEPCGSGGCCDGYHDWHCNAVAQRCEYHPDNPLTSAARDAGVHDE